MADGLGSRSLFLTGLEAGLMIVVNILSLVGNVLVCILVYRNPGLRTTTNLYIIALAASDLLSTIFVMPLTTGVLISGRWPFGESVCQIHAYFSLFVLYVSPVTMGLTALNRYVRICKSNQQYRLFFSKRRSRIVLGAAWTFIALYILVPRLTGLQGFRFVPSYAACLNKHLSKFGKILHYFVVVGLFFILPLAVTIFSYRKVLNKIREHNMGTAQSLRTQTRDESVSTNEVRISRSLFVVVFAFMLCWLPAWIITILTRLVAAGTMPRNVQLICTFCLSVSSTINPFIYAGMNPLFRREFRRLLGCTFGEKVEDNSSRQSSSKRPHTLSSAVRSEATADKGRAVQMERLSCRPIKEEDTERNNTLEVF